MSTPFTSNDGTTFYNINNCRSFNQTITTALVPLSSDQAQGYPCSEVIIVNKTGQNILVFDNDYVAAANAMALSADDTFVIRGITNTNQVSAKTTSGSGTLYYRSQFFSDLPQR